MAFLPVFGDDLKLVDYFGTSSHHVFPPQFCGARVTCQWEDELASRSLIEVTSWIHGWFDLKINLRSFGALGRYVYLELLAPTYS